MNFWMTTHWPPRVGDNGADESSGVWVPDGREKAVAEMRKGDLIVVYEARTGRIERRRRQDGTLIQIPCKEGREGMVCYGEVSAPISALSDSQPQEYADGTKIWWRWFAAVSILSRSGFVSRIEVLRILDYSEGYTLRGFGDYQSGVKKITKEQFDALVSAFRCSRPIELSTDIPRASAGHGEGGEGQIHLNLKSYVAADPATALGELGLRTLAVEYEFPTNDRADIVLVDRHERIVGVEIEPAVFDMDVIGILQAIKYRHMLECLTKRERGDSRGILVAHSISPVAQNVCLRYGIECKVVSRAAVDAWLATNAG